MISERVIVAANRKRHVELEFRRRDSARFLGFGFGRLYDGRPRSITCR
jgi:hypothetical protein